MIENLKLPPQEEERLRGRGLDDLLSEHALTSDAARKKRLEAFFQLALPSPLPISEKHPEVRLAGLAEMQAMGRVELFRAASAKTFSVLNRDIPDADISILDLSDSEILSDQTVIVEGAYLTDIVRHMSGTWLLSGEEYYARFMESVNRGEATARLGLTKSLAYLPNDKVYFLFHSVIGCASFGHFVLDMLVQLVVFDVLRIRYGDALTPLIANDQVWLFRWPGMEWLYEHLVGRLGAAVHVQRDARVHVKRAFTTNRLVHLTSGGIAETAFKYLRARLFSALAPTPGFAGPKRVYISRKDAGYREASNIAEVEQLLYSHGFQTISIQDLTPQGAFDMLYGAEAVVGMHGSGLMYHIYAKQSATVVELSYPGFEWDVILACAAACGHDAIRIGYKDHDVDMAALSAVLARLPSEH